MRKFLFLLPILAFCAGFFGTRYRPLIQSIQGIQGLHGGPKATVHFSPIQYPLLNRFFTLVIVGHNNGAYLAKTLASVDDQSYENFRVIYIDDASNDGSYELARDLIFDSERMAQYTIVRNDERLGLDASFEKVLTDISDEEIVLKLKDGEWLAHEWVLQELNRYYADPDLWSTDGGAALFPSLERTGNLPTSYASLLKKKQSSAGHSQHLPEILTLRAQE